MWCHKLLLNTLNQGRLPEVEVPIMDTLSTWETLHMFKMMNEIFEFQQIHKEIDAFDFMKFKHYVI